MKVFITGGTGFIGTALTAALIQNGVYVTILTRSASPQKVDRKRPCIIEGDPMTPGKWQDHLAGHDAVVNLAGASIFQRWNDKKKHIIRKSRILTTQHIVTALSAHQGKKIDLINASAVGFYGYRGDTLIDEGVSHGADFLASVSKTWEAEALKAVSLGSRVVLCRFGVVLGREGGALAKLLPLFKLGLGARLGTGTQWFSWIHVGDLTRILIHLLENRTIKGPVNCTAPNPVQNKEMTELLGRVLKRPTFLPPVPGFMIRIVLGEFANTLLKGQRVMPQTLLDRGFSFKYPRLEEALQDIVSG